MKYEVVIKMAGAKKAEYHDIEAKSLRSAKSFASKMLAKQYNNTRKDMIVWVWEGYTRYERKIYIPFGKLEPKVTLWSGPCQISML